MNKTYLIILILAVVGTCFSVGCMFEDKESKTLKEERERKREEKKRLAAMSIDEIKKELKKELLVEQQKAKVEADKGTRKSLLSIQKWSGLFILIGLIAAYALPAGRKKWGLGLAGAAVTAIIICATLSYYLSAFRLVTAILIGILILAGLILGVLWLRKSDAFKEVVPFTDKLIEKNPEALQEMKANKEIEHTESTKAQVRAVSKRKKNN